MLSGYRFACFLIKVITVYSRLPIRFGDLALLRGDASCIRSMA